MAISSTVVAKLGGQVEYVALNGGGSKDFSVTLPAGMWLVECTTANNTSSSNANPTIKGTEVGVIPGGAAPMLVSIVVNGGGVAFSGNASTRWYTGVAIKLS